ncbi:MAG: DUF4281 domain-containing protein [bacterium]|nr:DUF4281 domain-containing protein [bacterium]
MSPDLLFLLCNNGVLPAWLLLVFAPGWAWTTRLIHAAWIPGLLAIAYGFAISQGLAEAPEGGGFGSLAGVMALFTQPWAALGGWIHYLAFDLFVGAWEVRDARRRGIAHLWVVPCLVLTLMLGPLGLLAYLALRFGLTRELTLAE